MTHHAEIRTTDGRTYVGPLRRGTFTIDGSTIDASQVRELELDRGIEGGSYDGLGFLRLIDGNDLQVRGWLKGFFSQRWIWTITGHVTVGLEALGKDVTIEINSLQRLRVKKDRSGEKIKVTKMLCDELAQWQRDGLIDRFEGERVEVDQNTQPGIHWHLFARLAVAHTSGKDASILSIRSLAPALGEHIASQFSWKLMKVDLYQERLEIHLAEQS